MAGRGEELAEGVWHFQTPLWETNSFLVVGDETALVCDPCWTPEEIGSIHEQALASGRPIQLLLTHADYDHTCGIGIFSEATVVAGLETAEAVSSGRAADGLRTAAAEWGLDWEGRPRVDRIVDRGVELALEGFRVETVDTRGHVADGLAYVLRDLGIMLPGDYLSAITYPFTTWSVGESRRTCERLLDALERLDVERVVPGHGPPLSAAEARTIGEADVAYLEQLETAAREAVVQRLSPGDALLAAYSVVPPRSNTDDFEVYGIRAANAREALDEASGTPQ